MPVSKPNPRRKSPILSFVGEGVGFGPPCGRLQRLQLSWTARLIYRGDTPALVGHVGRNSKEFARDARVLFSLSNSVTGKRVSWTDVPISTMWSPSRQWAKDEALLYSVYVWSVAMHSVVKRVVL